MKRKMLSSPLLYLSAFFEATRSEYYKQLYNVSAKGTWNDWLIYFLNGVALQAEDVLSRVERINQLLFKWITAVANNGSQVLVAIVQRLAGNPYLTISGVTKELGIAYTTAHRAIQKLEEAGIIKKVRKNRRNKGYCAVEILNILDEPTKVTTIGDEIR